MLQVTKGSPQLILNTVQHKILTGKILTNCRSLIKILFIKFLVFINTLMNTKSAMLYPEKVMMDIN